MQLYKLYFHSWTCIQKQRDFLRSSVRADTFVSVLRGCGSVSLQHLIKKTLLHYLHLCFPPLAYQNMPRCRRAQLLWQSNISLICKVVCRWHRGAEVSAISQQQLKPPAWLLSVWVLFVSAPLLSHIPETCCFNLVF